MAGETTITVTTADGSKNAICKVTVEPNYIEVNGIKIAIGNLVADGAKGAKIGAPEDGGLYFQAGSLVGWSGGVTGDGIGNYPNSALSAWTTPTGYAGSTTWESSWIGDDELNTTTGTGDPCKYYLKGTWRLPTTTEYETLFANAGYPTTGPWKAEGTFSKDDIDSYAVHASGLKFSASGWRDISDGSLYGFSSYGAYWSATPCNGRDDWYSMSFSSSGVVPFTADPRAFGFPVRCVRD